MTTVAGTKENDSRNAGDYVDDDDDDDADNDDDDDDGFFANSMELSNCSLACAL